MTRRKALQTMAGKSQNIFTSQGCDRATPWGQERVSLFVDADPVLAEQAKSVGADRIEIYTGPYGGAFDGKRKALEFDKIIVTGKVAEFAGLGLNDRPS